MSPEFGDAYRCACLCFHGGEYVCVFIYECLNRANMNSVSDSIAIMPGVILFQRKFMVLILFFSSGMPYFFRY